MVATIFIEGRGGGGGVGYLAYFRRSYRQLAKLANENLGYFRRKLLIHHVSSRVGVNIAMIFFVLIYISGFLQI